MNHQNFCYQGLTGIAALKLFYLENGHEVVELDNGQLLVSAEPMTPEASIWDRVRKAVDRFVWGG